MLKKVLLSCILYLSLSASSYAYTDNYLCSLYTKLKVKNVEKVLAVGIRKVYTASVETYVLGFGTPIKTTLSGHKLTEEDIIKRRTLQCNGVTIGHVRIYDLSKFGEKQGEFSIESGDKKVATYIEIN